MKEELLDKIKLVLENRKNKVESDSVWSPEPEEVEEEVELRKSPIVLSRRFDETDPKYLKLLGKMHVLNKMMSRGSEASGKVISETSRQKIEQLLGEWSLTAQEFYALELTEFVDRKLIVKRLLAKNVTMFELEAYIKSVEEQNPLTTTQLAEIQCAYIREEYPEQAGKYQPQMITVIIIVLATLELIFLATLFAIRHV